MASSHRSSEEEARQLAAHLGKALKEGERILAPTRRPDGTLRKPIRIRAGYVPQEEVAIYQSKGALWKKEMESQVGPPGYDTTMDVLPKTKSVKRNERKKEKRLQAALEKAKSSEELLNEGSELEEEHDEDASQNSDSEETITSHLSRISLSVDVSDATPGVDSAEGLNPENSMLAIDKIIRALRKKYCWWSAGWLFVFAICCLVQKFTLLGFEDYAPGYDLAILLSVFLQIRLTEALQQKTSDKDMNPEQLDKVRKLEGWREELKLLEDKRVEMLAS